MWNMYGTQPYLAFIQFMQYSTNGSSNIVLSILSLTMFMIRDTHVVTHDMYKAWGSWRISGQCITPENMKTCKKAIGNVLNNS